MISCAKFATLSTKPEEEAVEAHEAHGEISTA
jgi:hypothetical protein